MDGRLAPLCVLLEHILDVFIQHRAVAGGNHFGLELPGARQAIGRKGLAEGGHDVQEVVVQRLVVGNLVLHPAEQHLGPGIVGAEEIAGEQRLAHRVPGEHGVRPVQVGHGEEAQLPVPQVERVALFDDAGLEIPLNDIADKGDGAVGADDGDIGVALQQQRDGARVVRLGVVDNQVIHLVDGRHFLHALEVLVAEAQLGRLNQRGLLTALQYKGIVAGAVWGIHDDIKNAKLFVLHADGIQVFP